MLGMHARDDVFVQGSGPTSILKPNYNVTQRMRSQKKVKYKDTREWTSVWDESVGEKYNTPHWLVLELT